MKDRIGEKHGRLTVAAYAGEYRWECLCECGMVKNITASNLKRTRSCGCLQQETKGQQFRVDVAGETYNRLTAIRDVGTCKQGRIWEWQCSCGNLTVVPVKHVRYGKTKSCGCLKDEWIVQMGRTYGPTTGKMNAVPLAERFWDKVDLLTRPLPISCQGFGPCLIWTGGLDTKGRAQLGWDGDGNRTSKRASHVAWFLAYGYWPEYLCHRCDNPACVEVNHLFEGNDLANWHDRRMKELGGISTPNGYQFPKAA